MKRYAKDKNLLTPPPVEQVEVSNKNIKLRVVLFVLFLVLAIVCFAVVMVVLLRVEAGWFAITPDTSSTKNCGGEFVFTYYFDKNQDKKYRQSVASKYTEAIEYAYKVFYASEEVDGMNNLFYLNTHPNEEVQVPALLYRSLKAFDDAGNRFLYYAPIYAYYEEMFTCIHDNDAERFDPTKNESVKTYFDTLISLIADENNVKLEFLDGNVVKLVVSDEYKNAFGENTPVYLDFFWTKNAFVIDYIASTMTDAGYDKGIISSYDGFTRNLSEAHDELQANVFDKTDDGAIVAGRLAYKQQISVVMLKDYAISKDEDGYYVYEDGTSRSHFVNVENGENVSAISTYTAYSATKTCSQIVLEILPLYLAYSFDTDKVASAKEGGIFSIYCKDGKILCNDENMTINPIERESGTYVVERIA